MLRRTPGSTEKMKMRIFPSPPPPLGHDLPLQFHFCYLRMCWEPGTGLEPGIHSRWDLLSRAAPRLGGTQTRLVHKDSPGSKASSQGPQSPQPQLPSPMPRNPPNPQPQGAVFYSHGTPAQTKFIITPHPARTWDPVSSHHLFTPHLPRLGVRTSRKGPQVHSRRAVAPRGAERGAVALCPPLPPPRPCCPLARTALTTHTLGKPGESYTDASE